MTKNPKASSAGVAVPLLLFLLLISATACHVRLVSAYDAKTMDETLSCAKMVDRFYVELLDTDEAKRPYSAFAKQYSEIEVELGGLLLRNQARSRNEDSVKIVQEILTVWRDVKETHRSTDAYRDAMAKADRDRFVRMFANAATLEGAKEP